VINAVFNHRQFHNSRAQPEFNGVNPFGYRDTSARVWMVSPSGGLTTIDIAVPNASLASQAAGPPLNSTEMSASDRTFEDIGHKLLLAKPLGLQKVDPTDGVLGSLADTTTGKGLKVSYTALIQQAFQQKWWNFKTNANGRANYKPIMSFWKGETNVFRPIKVNSTSFSAPMIEANFSLF
jgi:hypothetical protein